MRQRAASRFWHNVFAEPVTEPSNSHVTMNQALDGRRIDLPSPAINFEGPACTLKGSRLP